MIVSVFKKSVSAGYHRIDTRRFKEQSSQSDFHETTTSLRRLSDVSPVILNIIAKRDLSLSRRMNRMKDELARFFRSSRS